jgi:hypothetical protein
MTRKEVRSQLREDDHVLCHVFTAVRAHSTVLDIMRAWLLDFGNIDPVVNNANS